MDRFELLSLSSATLHFGSSENTVAVSSTSRYSPTEHKLVDCWFFENEEHGDKNSINMFTA